MFVCDYHRNSEMLIIQREMIMYAMIIEIESHKNKTSKPEHIRIFAFINSTFPFSRDDYISRLAECSRSNIYTYAMNGPSLLLD